MNQFIKSLLIALVGSAVANAIILYALGPLVTDAALPLHALSLIPVMLFTIVGVVGAAAVYAVMRTYMASPDAPFLWVSAIVLILSFIPDYLIIGQTTGSFAGGTLPNALVLALMHVVVAGITVWSLLSVWGKKSEITASN